MRNIVSSTAEVDYLMSIRNNLTDFHYYTSDPDLYDYFCGLVTSRFGLEVDPRTASNLTDDELSALNKKYGLSLDAAYLNGPTCGCGRRTNGYDFVVNAVFRHGAAFLRGPRSKEARTFVLPFRRAMNAIVCTDCGELNPLAAKTWYKDSSPIDKYGPCCSD